MTSNPPPYRPSSGAGTERAVELRRHYPRFVYERMETERAEDALRVRFHFRVESQTGPELEFAPETVFPGVDWTRVDALPKGAIENLLFHVGLVETLSYWKAVCSPEIRIEAGQFSEEQTAWFRNLLRRGMGEFFYTNRIDWRADDFVRPTAQERSEPFPQYAPQDLTRGRRDDAGKSLVLTSGGKDSAVALELLREAGQRFDCLLLNPTEAALAVARQAGCANPIILKRTLDPRLLALNEAGYLNGHTPFSALLAVLGVAAAGIYGYGRVIVANERSSEEPNVEYLGEEIHHQYSKTFRFETRFRVYCQTCLTPAKDGRTAIEYFSLVRPLYELQIAQLFARYPAYFPLFRSCNRGMKTNAWCGECPKCMFVYTVLYPFVGHEEMLAIFGKDLFAREAAAEDLHALLGLSGKDGEKPFECVGTREETLAAVYLCVERIKTQTEALPPALEEIERSVLAKRRDLHDVARRILAAWTEDHHVPKELAERIRRLHG